MFPNKNEKNLLYPAIETRSLSLHRVVHKFKYIWTGSVIDTWMGMRHAIFRAQVPFCSFGNICECEINVQFQIVECHSNCQLIVWPSDLSTVLCCVLGHKSNDFEHTFLYTRFSRHIFSANSFEYYAICNALICYHALCIRTRLGWYECVAHVPLYIVHIMNFVLIERVWLENWTVPSWHHLPSANKRPKR